MHVCLRCRHEWPSWQPQDLNKVFPTLGEDGVNLMIQMLAYDPAKRISVSVVALDARITASWHS